MGLGIKRVLLLLLLLQIGMQTRADFYYFLQHKDQKAYRINTETKYLERYEGNRKWLPLKAILFDSSTIIKIPKNIIIENIPSLNPDKVYFSANCTNQFYVLDLKTMVFDRMDETFYRGDNCHAYRFFRQGVLHSVGGYGFWRTNNHIIFFDEKSKEWEAYSSSGTPPPGIYGGFTAYLPEKDELITFMNFSHDINLNNGAFYRDKSIYSFSFKSRQWSKIGTVYSKEFIELFNIETPQPNVGTYFTGKYFMIPRKAFTGSFKYHAINPYTFEFISLTEDATKLSKFQTDVSISRIGLVLRNHDLILNIRPNQSENNVFEEAQLVNIDALFSKSTSLGYIDVNIWYKSEIFIGLISVLFISFLIWLSIKKGKSLFFKRFSYSNQFISSDKLVVESVIKLLNRLVETYPTGGIDVDETNLILGLNTLAHDAQRYKRSAIIKEANVKLAFITHCLDTIQRQDSDLDRRQKRYMINAVAFNAVKDFLKS
jgi:hypothetical protein